MIHSYTLHCNVSWSLSSMLSSSPWLLVIISLFAFVFISLLLYTFIECTCLSTCCLHFAVYNSEFWIMFYRKANGPASVSNSDCVYIRYSLLIIYRVLGVWAVLPAWLFLLHLKSQDSCRTLFDFLISPTYCDPCNLVPTILPLISDLRQMWLQ